MPWKVGACKHLLSKQTRLSWDGSFFLVRGLAGSAGFDTVCHQPSYHVSHALNIVISQRSELRSLRWRAVSLREAPASHRHLWALKKRLVTSTKLRSYGRRQVLGSWAPGLLTHASVAFQPSGRQFLNGCREPRTRQDCTKGLFDSCQAQ